MSNWFATWFDSHYYHILYQHRDDAEAEFFMDNLVDHLQIPANADVLDLACGKGRHAIYLSKKDLNVTGVDLSAESIKHAKQFEHDKLHFQTHDMRQAISFGPFDAIFNLFTSFGYFDSDEMHLQTLQQMQAALKDKDSPLVIDFFNAHKVIQKLVLQEEKEVQGILFRLERKVENGYIVKDIRFEDQEKAYHFQERVRAFVLDDFRRMLKSSSLQLTATFGDYDLSAFDAATSNRLILILHKK